VIWQAEREHAVWGEPEAVRASLIGAVVDPRANAAAAANKFAKFEISPFACAARARPGRAEFAPSNFSWHSMLTTAVRLGSRCGETSSGIVGLASTRDLLLQATVRAHSTLMLSRRIIATNRVMEKKIAMAVNP